MIIIAWHIPKELMNNNPLQEEEVRKRFEEKGYKIIKYCYVSNRTRMPCMDLENYIVMVSLDSLRQNIKTYQRFSPTCNKEYFMYNINRYRELHSEVCKVVGWEYREIGKKKKKQVHLQCVCEKCGNIFYVTLLDWRKGRTRCAECVAKKSNIEYKVQKWLEDGCIDYIPQYKFDDCKDKRRLPFDFYIPKKNLCIEVNGGQHYNKENPGYFIKHKFTKEEIEEVQRHDKIKRNYCEKNKINLLVIDYAKFQSERYKELLEKALL